MQALRRAEQLLLVELLLAAVSLERDRGRCATAPRSPAPGRSGQAITSASRARVIATWASISRRSALSSSPGSGSFSPISSSGIQPSSHGARLDRAAAQAEQVDVVELEPLDLLGLGDEDRAGDGTIGVVGAELAGVGDGGQVADEVAHRAARLAPRPVGGQLGEVREVDQPLRGLGARREELVAAQAHALDEPADEDVGAHLLERVRGGAVQPQERLDPVARLRRQLRALERRLERRNHVELAPAGDRRDLREIDRAQVDRRARQRPDDRGSVGGIGEHPQPGERVADLRALEEGGVAGEAKRHAALLEGGGDQAALPPARARDHADSLRRGPRRRRAGARPRARPPGPGRGRSRSARSG